MAALLKLTVNWSVFIYRQTHAKNSNNIFILCALLLRTLVRFVKVDIGFIASSIILMTANAVQENPQLASLPLPSCPLWPYLVQISWIAYWHFSLTHMYTVLIAIHTMN